ASSTLPARRSTPPMLSRFRLITLAATLPLLGACDWFTEFKAQPRVEPWEPLSQVDSDTIHAPRGQPAFAVPVTGTFVAPYQVSYLGAPATLDSIATVVTNPTPVSAASLANGRKYYQINCAVCHGDQGQGNGPAVQYGMAGISIVMDMTKNRPDGYIYGIIRNGRGAMPTYNRIEEMDRWDVVNYVRALQGRVPNTAGVGPTGYPGQNGATVPGHTTTAPNLPAPMWRPAGAAGTQPAAGVQPGVQTPTAAEVQGQTPAAPAAANDSGPQGSGAAPAAPAARPQTPQPKGDRK
ncbi:MAG: c-type cytochrome, partial [Gemmatirosa sp.]